LSLFDAGYISFLIFIHLQNPPKESINRLVKKEKKLAILSWSSCLVNLKMQKKLQGRSYFGSDHQERSAHYSHDKLIVDHSWVKE